MLVSVAGSLSICHQTSFISDHNDDELADIIAHEMGHVVTHQVAVDYSRLFAQVLG